jgi:hypothetical protein
MSADVICLQQAREALKASHKCVPQPLPYVTIRVSTSAQMLQHLFERMDPDDFLEFTNAVRDETVYEQSDSVVKELVEHYYMMRTAEGTHP